VIRFSQVLEDTMGQRRGRSGNGHGSLPR
jgi:hypothetical protein